VPAGFPNSGVAQGSIFTLFGSGLGPPALTQVTKFPLPKSLAGTSIQITVGGTPVDAIMLWTVASQVAAILPSSTPTGSAQLVLTYNGSASDPIPFQVVTGSFGAFTLNSGGSGTAVITNAANKVITLLNSAKPGDTVSIWSTGLGPVTGDETAGPLPGNMKNLNIKVWVGGKSATLAYAGRSGCCSGLDQLVIKVPTGVQGCFVPLAVQVGGVISTFPSIPVAANGGTCSDPEGLTADMMQKAASGKSISVGTILLSRFTANFVGLPLIGNVAISEDAGSAYFYSYSPNQLLGSRGVTALSAFGSCSLWQCSGATCVPDEQALSLPGLDAGASIIISRAHGGTKQLTKVSTGAYAASLGGGGIPGLTNNPDPYLDPDSYAITGPGGSVVKAFTANINIGSSPISFQAKQNDSVVASCCSNSSSTGGTISRSADLNISWSGGDPNGYAVIVGTSTADAPQVTASFACMEKNSAGQFTVPSWVLSGVPKSGTLSQAGLNVSNGFLLMGSYPSFTSFSAPGLDFGFASSLVVSGTNEEYQ
jgi:uncharacterized protein (TIGR03437 family)